MLGRLATAQSCWRRVAGVACALLLPCEEVGSGHAERPGQAVDDVEGRVPPAALNAGDVCAVEVCTVGEVLLRPAPSDPELAHSCAEGGAVG